MAKLIRKGTQFNDTIFGTTRDEAFFGLEGHDRFYGSQGADDYDGGTGTDTVNYSGSSSGVTVYLHKGYGKTGDAAGDTYKSIENIVGSSYNDYIYGDDADNVLQGGNGHDRLYGGNGADRLYGGNGVDRLYGGSHADRLYGGNDNDYLYGGSGNDTLDGGRGADLIHGGSGTDTVSYSNSSQGVTVSLLTGQGFLGDAQGDILAYVENVTGSYWYADTLIGNDADNVLDGQRGDDLFIGTEGNDTIIGGIGQDTLDYSTLSVGIGVDLGAGSVDKTFLSDDTVSGIETVIGTDRSDTFRGSSAEDTFFGGGSFDRFYGSAGADHFDGGDGNDAIYYSDSSSGVIVDLAWGVGQFGDAEGDTFASIESVYGSQYGDWLIGTDERDDIFGGDGDDMLHGHGGDDVIHGGSGSDTIIAGSGDDRITADSFAMLTADDIDGGNGFDIVHYDVSYSGAQLTVDLAAGTASDGDTLSGIEGVSIKGNDATVFGDGQSNRFEVFGFDNEFSGQGGNDTFVVFGHATSSPLIGNVYDGGAGTDTIDYSTGLSPYLSQPGIEVDLDDGTTQSLQFPQLDDDELNNIENVIGSLRDDRIFGDDGANVLDGEDGDDLINGRDGDDTLTGGDGADVFVFDHRDSGEDDIITDFVIGEDRIDLSNSEIDDFADLQNAGDGDYFEQVGNNVVIHSSDEDTITLLNTQLSELVLSPESFLF